MEILGGEVIPRLFFKEQNMSNEKLDRIIIDRGLDALLLTDGYNIHYLTGYTGQTGCMVYVDGEITVITDSRYTEQLRKEAKDVNVVDVANLGYKNAVREILNNKIKTGKVGFEDKEISYQSYNEYKNALKEYTLLPLGESINQLRYVKNKEEIARLRRAEAIGDEAFSHIIGYMENHEEFSEMDLAIELETYMKKNGASALSFDTIVASSSNSSMPHASVTGRIIKPGDVITMDFGCIYDGYCSDMTRTVVYKESKDKELMTVYNTVLSAQKRALNVIKPGVSCSVVDAAARDYIREASYGDYFGHGLGHSVGLYIHEEPRFSPSCNCILEPGMVITVEPGIYLPGRFGVRIEDLIVVTEDGYENLTHSPKELLVIG